MVECTLITSKKNSCAMALSLRDVGVCVKYTYFFDGVAKIGV